MPPSSAGDAPVSAAPKPVAPPVTEQLTSEPWTPGLPSRFTQDGVVLTSFVRGADGSTYTAGTFLGTISLGSAHLASRGREDVFLAKWGPDASLVWALSAGSAESESSPRISRVEGGRVTIIGMTAGEMDCGGGPLAIWTTATFFLCVYGAADGSWIEGGTFPTGSP